MTEQQAKDLLAKWMDEQVGYKETPTNINKYAAYLDSLGDVYNGKKNGYAWCDVFVDCGFVQCFGEANGLNMIYQPKKSLGAGAEFSAKYYKANGAFYSKPQMGDQIFYTNYDHTGWVREVTKTKVITIEGNWNDQVSKRELSLSDKSIVGYGRPDWSVVKDVPAEMPEVSFLLKQGSRSQAVEVLQMGLIMNGYEIYGGVDGYFGSYTKAALVSYQQANGLTTDGTAGTETFRSLLS